MGGAGLTADEAADGVVAGEEFLGDGAADEAGGAGECDGVLRRGLGHALFSRRGKGNRKAQMANREFGGSGQRDRETGGIVGWLGWWRGT